MPSTTSTQAVIWLRPEQEAFVADALRLTGDRLALVGVGCPVKGKGAGLASTLGAEPTGDLRATLSQSDASLIILADPGEFGGGGSVDAAALDAARARGAAVLTLEPLPGAALELGSGSWTRSTHGARAIDALWFAPRLTESRAARDAADALDAFATPRLARFESVGRPEHGTLGARLASAMEGVVRWMGEPSHVDATYVGPTESSGAHALPGSTLAGLHGELVANLRFSDGRGAIVLASDRGPAWTQGATLFGPEGRLDLDSDGMVWTNPDGRPFDTQHVAWSERELETEPAARALGDAISRHVSEATTAPMDLVTTLAVCQAALLSARTGQGESPMMIRRLIGGP